MLLVTLCSMPVAPAGVSHTAACATAAVHAAGLPALHLAPRVARGGPRQRVRIVLDPFRGRLRGRRALRTYEHSIRSRLQQLREREAGLVVWSWTGQSTELLQSLRGDGVPVIAEKYNCMTRTARTILEDAGRRLGVPDAASGLTDRVIEKEEATTRSASLVSTPAPEVTRSVIEAGIDPARIVETGYGWDPARCATSRPASAASGGREPVFTFLGRGGIRKGLPLLLDAWRIARDRGTPGRLRIVGDVDEAVRRIRGPLLDRDDVEVRGWSSDVGAVLAGSDAFVFPTLEEGSPIVVLEAIAHGLPVLTSPMGAGRVVRDGREGLVRDPWNAEAVAEAIRLLGREPERREALGRAARRRAMDYRWDAIGATRAAAFRGRLERPPAGGEPIAIGVRGEDERRWAA